jgi:hypothetical protein
VDVGVGVLAALPLLALLAVAVERGREAVDRSR